VRLGLGFGLVALLLSAALGFGISLIRDLNGSVDNVTMHFLPNTIGALQLQVTLNESARDMRTLALLDDPKRVALVMERLDESAKKRAAMIGKLEKAITSPEGKARVAEVLEQRGKTVPLENEFLKKYKEEKRDVAVAFLLEKVRPAQLDLTASLAKLADSEIAMATAAGDQAATKSSQGVMLLAAATLVALVLAAIVAWLATRSIVVPLATAVGISGEITKGNLRNQIQTGRRDELGVLLESLHQMQHSLGSLVRQIQGGAGEVSSAAAALVSTAEQVAVSTENQSTAAAAMAASVEEMTVSINHISESAQSASTRTGESSELSEKSRGVVNRASSEMTAIASGIESSAGLVRTLQEQSREISTIAEVIKNIAEQTNLLALNAAIEAARAGENGRGFAVVADAVRGLAERTTNSTVEIAATIAKIQQSTDLVFQDMNVSVERARSGLTLSQEAGESIASLAATSLQVMSSVSEISSALKEQSQASNDIARHVESIAQMAEENTGAVAHTKDSAQRLEGLAEGLQTAVMRFSV
ncbi:MAG TPA: methyl-accepting chemotaxis protein, partial [Burkholderiales bacterium]|nr:methyl-accepting chemotaxis protein [Burkholderiales bacterium]